MLFVWPEWVSVTQIATIVFLVRDQPELSEPANALNVRRSFANQPRHAQHFRGVLEKTGQQEQCKGGVKGCRCHGISPSLVVHGSLFSHLPNRCWGLTVMIVAAETSQGRWTKTNGEFARKRKRVEGVFE